MNWRTYECDFCPRFVACRSQASKVVVATPCRTGGLLIVGEAPGDEEDSQGIGFIGRAGNTLRTYLHDNDLFWPDYGIANICRCRPPRNNERNFCRPNWDEIDRCLPYLASLIRDTSPRVILALGAETAGRVFFGTDGVDNQLDLGRQHEWSAERIRQLARDGLQDALEVVTYIVSMPHTAARGKKHKLLAESQVKRAVDLFRE